MPEQITIFYGGRNPFAPQPVPFVGMDESNLYYGEQWAKAQSITLEGSLTGCTFDLIASAQANLLNNFRRSYQTLEIHQRDLVGSGIVLTAPLVEVAAIDFSSSRWQGILPYTIRLNSYPSGYFSGTYGVLDPVDSWNYQEQNNYIAQITHTVSCRGINTSNSQTNALSNAANWCIEKRGSSGAISPTFISNLSSPNFTLVSSNENINRFNGTYSITDNYINDLARNGYGTIRYTTTIDSGNGIISVGIQGTVKGGQRQIEQARAAFSGFNPTGAALFAYSGAFGLTDLNPYALTQSITEDPNDTAISFSYEFDNNSLAPTYFDYSVGLSSGSILSVNVNGEIVARGGTSKQKLQRAKEFAKSIDLYQTVLPFYLQFYPEGNQNPLNPRPVSSGISVNESKGSVQLNAEFNAFEQFSSDLISFDYSIDLSPSSQQIAFTQTLDGYGKCSMVDLGYASRATLVIQGEAVINPESSIEKGVAAAKDAIQLLFKRYGSTQNLTSDRAIFNKNRADERRITFDYQWAFGSPHKIADRPYLTISTLGI